MTTSDILGLPEAGEVEATALQIDVPSGRLRSRAIGVPAVLVVAPAVFLSAMLLFSAEPLVGRLVLPLFGGGPGVWAVVLAFFQGVLVLGYLYAHLAATRLGPRRAALLHVVLVAFAASALALVPAHLSPLRDQARPPEADLLLVLAVVIGPASFVLTATTPLLSSWYAALVGREKEGRDPYWLYALSNLGSLGALLAYPFVIEPLLGLGVQRSLWAAAFVILGVLLVCAAIMVRVRLAATQPATPSRSLAVAAPGASTLSGRRRLAWVLLAAVPAGLLSAVTNFIAADFISAPLLWIGPLAIYLATFVVAFSRIGRSVVPRARWLAPVALTLLWIPLGSNGGWPVVPLLALEYGAFAVAALALHGRLADDRPDPSLLTEYYLLVSIGGVLGGSFVAFVAPAAFPSVWEYPILLVGGLALLAWATPPGAGRSTHSAISAQRRSRGLTVGPLVAGAPGRLLAYGTAGLILLLALLPAGQDTVEVVLRWLVVGGLLLLVGGRPAFLASATALVLVLTVFVIPQGRVLQARSFFGVSEVVRPASGSLTALISGTTIHGEQWTAADRRREPLTYYARSGPAGDLFAAVDGAVGRPGASIGVVGLGAGSLAAYERAGDRMTFYEIDPVVVRIAEDANLFTYLADAPSRPTVVLGDARLSLEGVPTGSHDLLVLDAFSSDAIPVHLLTREAFVDYARTLTADGTIAVHVSNRYYDLRGPVAAAIRSVGLEPLERTYVPTPDEAAAGAVASTWVVGSRDRGVARGLESVGWAPASGGQPPLTDDFSDLLRYLRLQW